MSSAGEETSTNAKAEWDINTGIFRKNPESDTVFGVSGVINYLNQFGRTGPVPGRYKKFDPVGELYYQTLRYMQGLPPTGDAVSNLGTPSASNALYDGYPVYADWTNIDPYGGSRSPSEDYSCVRSNVVVIGDINTHDGNWRNIPSADDPANNVTNFRTWHTLVQNFEKGVATRYIDGQGVTRTSSNPNAANTSVPSNSQTSQIMGYAYWAHTQDIRGRRWTAAPAKQRPGLRVKTFLFDVNEYGRQNDANVRRRSNQFFMAAKYGGFTSTSPILRNLMCRSTATAIRSEARPEVMTNRTITYGRSPVPQEKRPLTICKAMRAECWLHFRPSLKVPAAVPEASREVLRFRTSKRVPTIFCIPRNSMWPPGRAM
ncbi:hypothetical protein GO496_00445 [Acidovorax citrulli]|nr:hypothetical protein [Paracidovorax citrulli]